MRGEEVLAALRADATTAGVPVVILTADATPSRLEQLLEQGASDYVTKPIDVKRLLEIVGEQLPREGGARSSAGVGSATERDDR